MKIFSAMLLSACLAAAPSLAQDRPASPPIAEIRNQDATHHGVLVPDPYRWMEDVKSAPAQAWMKAQGAAARSQLDRIDGREQIFERLVELTDAQGDAVYRMQRLPGERLYYLKRFVGQRQAKLAMRVGTEGAERILFDPEAASRRTGTPHAVNYFRASWDGKYLAYGVSAGGSEDASLHVIEIASGKRVIGPVPSVPDSGLHWLPDSRSLLYTQLKKPRPGEPETEVYLDSRVMWRSVDRGAARPVFGRLLNPRLKLERLDTAEIHTAPGSRWMAARTTDTTVPEGKLFVAPLATLGKPATPWRQIADASQKVSDIALHGDALYVLHRLNAPRRALVRLDLNRGDGMAQAELVAAPPEGGVLEDFVVTPRAVLAEVRQGTSVVLRRYERGDAQGQAIVLPAAGTASLARAPGLDSESLPFVFSRWTEPSRWMWLDGTASAPVAFGVEARLPPLPEIEVRELNFASHDGVMVPMTVLHRKGLALDGRNTVLLEGYGSYGASTSAYFSGAAMAWLERGGVVAHVNPRGSGVYGDDWHRAGFKSTKANTWKDGIAAARWLIAQGYGSARTMTIKGTSAGGIFVGRAVTEAPELFAAAIFDVGMLDAVRAENSANGITNISEFGTVADPTEFRALLEMSTYHAIRDGTEYPGVLLVHGMNDPRVDVWNSSKTAARLQAASPASRPGGSKPALLRLDRQAGHGMGSTVTQRQQLAADEQAFLLWQTGKLGLRD